MQNNKGVRLNVLPPVYKLTPVEQRIWDLYKAGKKRPEIAQELNMKPTSVSRRLSVAKEKMFLR